MHSIAAVSVVAALGSALAIGSIDAGRAVSAVDPCTLLTTAQVSGAIGGTAAAGKPIGTTGCSWSTNAPKATVTISSWVPTGFAHQKAASSPGIVTTPLSGVGDDAFYKEAAGFTTLTVKKSNTAFVVRVYGFPDSAKQRQIEKTLATDAAAKL